VGGQRLDAEQNAAKVNLPSNKSEANSKKKEVIQKKVSSEYITSKEGGGGGREGYGQRSGRYTGVKGRTPIYLRYGKKINLWKALKSIEKGKKNEQGRCA